MRLRTKIFLWLAPVLIPLLLFIFLNYSLQSKNMKEQILRISSLAVENGAGDISAYLHLQEANFILLVNSITGEIDNLQMKTQDADNKVGLLMKTNPGFSLLALTDINGNIQYNKISVSKRNTYIHPRDITGENALNAQQIDFLIQLYKKWKQSISSKKLELDTTTEYIRHLETIGQTNSLEYRDAQIKKITLQDTIKNPPHMVFIGGEQLAAKAGLPFRSNSYIFAVPVLTEQDELKGFLLGILDWVELEDQIYCIKSNLISRGLPGADVVLFDKKLNMLMSGSKKVFAEDLDDIVNKSVSGGDMVFSENIRAYIASMPIADANVLSSAEGSDMQRYWGNDFYEKEIREKSDIYLTVYVPERDVAEYLSSLFTNAAAFTMLSILLFVILITFLSYKIIKPLKSVSFQMKRISEGDFSARVTAAQTDEIGQLVETFNEMTEKLEKHQKEIERYTCSLQKANEELKIAKKDSEEAAKAKSNFLARMSHEIRTPMNAIIGMAYLVLNTELTSRQADYIKKIKTSADLLLAIINDLLDFSKIEAGKTTLEKINFHLDDIFDYLANVNMIKAKEKGLEVIFSAGPAVPLNLVGDPLRLKQVLTNLLSNAIKFTDKGEVMISVTAAERHEETVTLRFSVVDTGIGISGSEIDRLFQPFNQADETTTRKYGGTGLGLAICKHLVELMGGRIWAESIPGQGSSFIFTSVLGLGKAKKLKLQSPIADLRGLKTLVVDDNDSAREVLSAMLTALSFDVTKASSGEEALRMIETSADNNNPYDLVLMDWQMPNLDGIETSYLIKNKKNMARVPAVLMITAYDLEEVRKNAFIENIDGFLTKPVNQSSLFDAIIRIFDKESRKKDIKSLPLFTACPQQLSDAAGANVLLAEDNSINQQIASELLKQAGINVDIVDNGLKAIAALAENKYDLVLMDIQMPELDGIEATRRIRSQAGYADLPIVAMTANALAGDREKSLEAGMNDHITKPLDPDKFMETVVKWIKPGKNKTSSLSNRQSTEDEAEVLPDLKTIDTTEGLKKVYGNRKLFKQLLGDFFSCYRQAVSEIERNLKAGDFKKVHIMVHTVKGVAGNIGASSLYKAAGNFELALKNRQSDSMDDLFLPFAEEFDAVLEELSGLAEDIPVQMSCNTGDINKTKVIELLADLRPLLENGNLEAGDLIPAIRETLVREDTADTAATLIEQIQKFDYEKAAATLNQIIARMNLE